MAIAAAVGRDFSLRFETRRRDDLSAAAGVDDSLPSQQLNVRSPAGDGGDVPRVIAGRRIGAAWANALDQNC